MKGSASAQQLYDLQNSYVTNAGSVVPREGTSRTETLDSQTVGLAAANGTFNVFSTNNGLASPVLGALIVSATGGSGFLTSGTTYYYVITAQNANGETAVSNEVSITATGAACSILLKWSAVLGVDPVFGYNLYRGTSPGGENYGTDVGNVTTYIDQGFQNSGATLPTGNTTPISVPTGYALNVLSNPHNRAAALDTIWFAKPFMGFEFVVAEFQTGDIVHYWLQNDGTWTTNTDYTTASIILPLPANGLAYQGINRFTTGTVWTPETVVTSGAFILPNSPTGFAYEVIGVAGSPVHTGQVEPDWPTVVAGQIQEFGDFDQSSTDAGTTQSSGSGVYSTAAPLSDTITNKYGSSATISNSGVYTSSFGTLSTLTLASTKVKTWVAGTTYPSGSVVIPILGTNTYINAIPNGDFSGGSGAGGWTFADFGGAAAWNYTTGSSPLSIGMGADVGGACLGIPGGTSMGVNGASATMLTSGAVSPGQYVLASGYCNPNNNGADLTIWIQLNWYDNTNTLIATTGNKVNEQEGYNNVELKVSGNAPAGATGVRVAVYAGAGTENRNEGFVGGLFWNLESASLPTNFLYEAVQPASGISSATQPLWPTVLGNEVIDGTVTWQAIGTSIITYEAIPMMQSGVNPPTFPIAIGSIVLDTSTFKDANGFIINTTMAWQAIDRSVLDTGDPNTIPVVIGASHVFAGNNDIADYSAAVNPIDWSSTNNAGYLPTGLNNYGDNPIAALALYRGNLVAFNAGGYQMWQIDPDPQNMAFLDAQPVGSTYPRAAQSVANDLIFLTEVGVRNLGTIGATANMAIGNTGQPVDPLIVAQLTTGGYVTTGNSKYPFSIYYPGRGQYWIVFGPQAFVLTINGLQGTKSWSRYLFPESLTDWTLNSGSLFLRTANNLVWKFDGTVVGQDDYNMSGATLTSPALSLHMNGNFSDSSFNNYSVLATGAATFTSAYVHTGYGLYGGFFPYVASTPPVNAALIGITPGSNLDILSGTGDFTITGWFYIPGVPPTGFVCIFDYGDTSTWTGGGNGITLEVNTSVNTFEATSGVPSWGNVGSPSYTVGMDTWNFFALVRYQGVVSLYLNGNQIGGTTNTWHSYAGPPGGSCISIGGTLAASNNNYPSGVIISELTVTKGVALYTTGGFAVPTGPTPNPTVPSVPFAGVMQWPYLDMGALGLNKGLIGVDLVGEGGCSVQVAFNQQDKTTFCDNAGFSVSTGVTAPYFIAVDDTVPGEPLPIPCNAPSYSLILTFPGVITTTGLPNPWSWEAANFYLMPAGGGGVTG